MSRLTSGQIATETFGRISPPSFPPQRMAARPVTRWTPSVRLLTLVWLGCAGCLVLGQAGVLSATPHRPNIAGTSNSQDLESQFEAHLATGEYRQAQEIANRLDPEARDAWLARLARHQADHGAFGRAVETTSFMQSDEARSSTLSGIGGSAFDGGSIGGRGGGAAADFDSLMDLIENTVSVDSWDTVGGPGTMEPFRSGVHVDATGTLKKIETALNPRALDRLRRSSESRGDNVDAHVASRLRKVSLNRLEKEVQLRHAQGLPPTEVMKNLAGLQRIEYVFVYPETGDVVIAGPAGDWQPDSEGRAVSVENRRPILQLDDLVVCLRNAWHAAGRFGCSIDPRPENLAETQQFLATSPLTGRRWREELQRVMGMQDITIEGIDPTSHTAHVIVEADYRMKLIGIGLEDGTLGVESYLDMIELDENGNPPPMDVVRWWFAMKYDGITTTEARNGFHFSGPAVQVLSESEFLAATGERVHTGKSTGPTAAFAESFTKHFDDLAEKYPVYGQLRNVFDLALVSALIREEKLHDQVDWNLTFFGAPNEERTDVYDVSVAASPKQVATVMNHREIATRQNGRRLRHTVVAVSGGVVANVAPFVQHDAIKLDQYGLMAAEVPLAKPQELDHHQWWWDN